MTKPRTTKGKKRQEETNVLGKSFHFWSRERKPLRTEEKTVKRILNREGIKNDVRLWYI